MIIKFSLYSFHPTCLSPSLHCVVFVFMCCGGKTFFLQLQQVGTVLEASRRVSVWDSAEPLQLRLAVLEAPRLFDRRPHRRPVGVRAAVSDRCPKHVIAQQRHQLRRRVAPLAHPDEGVPVWARRELHLAGYAVMVCDGCRDAGHVLPPHDDARDVVFRAATKSLVDDTCGGERYVAVAGELLPDVRHNLLVGEVALKDTVAREHNEVARLDAVRGVVRHDAHGLRRRGQARGLVRCVAERAGHGKIAVDTTVRHHCPGGRNPLRLGGVRGLVILRQRHARLGRAVPNHAAAVANVSHQEVVLPGRAIHSSNECEHTRRAVRGPGVHEGAVHLHDDLCQPLLGDRQRFRRQNLLQIPCGEHTGLGAVVPIKYTDKHCLRCYVYCEERVCVFHRGPPPVHFDGGTVEVRHHERINVFECQWLR
eukprot:PhM_4_TR11312/c1_g1_i1/m.99428